MPQATDRLNTVCDWLRFATSEFSQASLVYGHGVDNAYDEAVWLVLGALKLPFDRLEIFLSAKLTERECQYVAHLVEQRVQQRVPVAYLLKEAWLQGYSFYVDERVIIPRSFIAECLGDGLQAWLTQTVGRALDLCTGSGCLSILLAHTFPSAHIVAVDNDAAALEVAKINVNRYGLSDRIALQLSDLFSALEGECYDLIVCNPPYVTEQSMAELPNEYRHEPSQALRSGVDGLVHIRQVLSQAHDYLNAGGWLLLEVGHNQQALMQAYPTLPFIWLEVAQGDQYVCLLSKTDLETLIKFGQ